MDAQTISALAQFGFPAVMAGLLLVAYRDLSPKLIKALEETATANSRIATALENNSRMIQHLADTVGWLEKRLIQIEAERVRRSDEPATVR